MPARILIAEHQEITRRFLVEELQKQGFQVAQAATGEQAKNIISGEALDLALLDLQLAVESGIDLLHLARDKNPAMQIIILAPRRSFEAALKGIRYRASDYLVKPLNARRLSRAVQRALARKTIIHVGTEDQIIIRTDGVEVDFSRRIIRWDEQQVDLTPSESRLLQALMKAPGRIRTHAELVQEVQGYTAPPEEASLILRPLVSRLRNKLVDVPGGGNWVVNVRGQGYLYERRSKSNY
jgi:two-component system OmpR family response regulator